MKMTSYKSKFSTVNAEWTIMLSSLMAILWYIGCGNSSVVAQAASCTSMDGPYCSFVNGKALPSHLAAAETFSEKGTLGELLGGGGISGGGDGQPIVQEVQKLVNGLMQQLKEQQHPLKSSSSSASAYPQVDSGSFEIEGFALSEMNFVQLFPGQWINKPGDHWIRVGLRGGFQEKNLRLYTSPDTPFQMSSSMLVFSLTDASPNKLRELNQCSKVLLVRTRKGLRRNVLDGIWRGRYSCGGSRTALRLVLITSKKRKNLLRPQPTNRVQTTKIRTTRWLTSKTAETFIRGTFNFVAETFPGRDSTLAGCKCVFKWSYEGVTITDGKCGKPDVGGEKPWCFIEQGTCTRSPAGVNWDYCEENKEEEFQIQFVFNQEGDFLPA